MRFSSPKLIAPPINLRTRLPRGIAVVMPALDEEESVGAAVRHWKDWGADTVIVVDNGSRDATSLRARAAGAQVVREEHRGYGAAAWTGAQHLPRDAEWILFASADGSDFLDEKSAQNLSAAMESGADLIVGDRTRHSESRRHLTGPQRFGNRLSSLLIAVGWAAPVYRDMGSLRVVEREAFERLALRDRGFGWNIEMQVRAIEAELIITEVPVRYRPRTAGEPKISGNLRGAIRAGRDILAMIARLWWMRHNPLAVKASEPPASSRGIEALSIVKK
ncbi:MAG: glycosyltransferase family 2 protein [Verrucomicrobiales bacterium]|nr:glycosyltransferase family 2 protein [Verrucomicrobiales bacterium]